MKVGGGVLRTAEDIARLPVLLKEHEDTSILVVSALGKTTNALDRIAYDAWNGDPASAGHEIDTLVQHHISLCETLGMHAGTITETAGFGDAIRRSAATTSEKSSYAEFADGILPYGERLSAFLISSYLRLTGVRVRHIDACDIMITNTGFGAAKPLFSAVREAFTAHVLPCFNTCDIVVVEGYIGCTEDGIPTTLGREGSDYSAAVFASLLQAEELILYKDVPGVLSCDPKIDGDACVLPRLSYDEAERLFKSGAKVVHPCTIKPVRDAGITINILPFEGRGHGTIIGPQPGWTVGRIFSVSGKPIGAGVLRASGPGLEDSKQYSLISLLGGYPYSQETCDAVEGACRDAGIVIIDENHAQKGWIGITDREQESETIRLLHQRLIHGTGARAS